MTEREDRDELVEAIADVWSEHKVTRHPDSMECAVCGDIGWAIAADRHAIRVILDAALAAGCVLPGAMDEKDALLREAFNVVDSTHARAYGRDVLPLDHGTVTYCYACEFAAKLGKYLGLQLNYNCPAAIRVHDE